MRKGISPEKIAYLIFALLGALIILAVFLNFYTSSHGGLFCTVYGGVYSLLPAGDETPPLPRSCIKSDSLALETEFITSTEKSEVEDRLVEYIVGCYLNNRKYGNNTMPCYEVEITSLAGAVSEKDITDNMALTGYICRSFANSRIIGSDGTVRDYSSSGGVSCGTKDQLLWLVHENSIVKGDIVEIKYVNDTVKVIT